MTGFLANVVGLRGRRPLVRAGRCLGLAVLVLMAVPAARTPATGRPTDMTTPAAG